MEEQKDKLSRSISLPRATLYGTGAILGAGIYALIGKIAGASGLLAPVSFLVSAIIAAFTAYSYVQLVKIFPKSAGEAEYVYQAFNNRSLSNIIGWSVALTGIVSASTLINGFKGYFKIFLDIPDWSIVCLVITIALVLAVKGIKESLTVIAAITILEIGGLLLICSTGFEGLIDKNFLIPQTIESFSSSQVRPILVGAFLAFYAYIGFEDIVNLGEETKAPGKTLSLAIILSLIISTVLYILVALVAISSMPLDALVHSKAPLAEMYQSFGGNPMIMSFIALFAIFNGILAQIIMSSRILYGLKHPFKILKILSRVHPQTKTPIVSTLFVTVFIFILTQLFNLSTLATATSFIILIVFTFVNFSLVLCERKVAQKNIWNIVIPVIAIILNISFLIFRVASP
jgi:APA family basic amino acid/polyamine antiporter